MTIFYIDTSSNYLYTGIVLNNELLSERKECLGHDLSTYTIDEVRKMFDEVNLEARDIDKIIVVNGPGSFTGIRIGVTLAKLLAYCLHKEITTISSLEAMAVSTTTDKLVVPIINARRDSCYGAIYDHDNCVMDKCYLSLSKLNLFLKGIGKDYVFVSNDQFDFPCLPYNPDILKIVKTYQNRESINPHLVNPNYLKLTEAEENKKKEVNT